MNLNTQGLSPTHLKMLQVLSDGKDHEREELEGCLSDPLSKTLHTHLTVIRKVLRPQGQDIKCVLIRGRRIGYCWIQLCPPAYESWAYHHIQQIRPTG